MVGHFSQYITYFVADRRIMFARVRTLHSLYTPKKLDIISSFIKTKLNTYYDEINNKPAYISIIFLRNPNKILTFLVIYSGT